MRYLVTARVKDGQRAPLARAIEDRTLGAGSVAGDEYFRNMADARELEPMFDRHRQWISSMWGRECAREGYGGMADMYLAHPDFRSHFDMRGEGFTDWLTTAMKAYAARG